MDKKAFYKISYGLYVITSANNGKMGGQIANSLIQVTSSPPAVIVCLNKNNFTHGLIEKSGSFGVSVLSKETPLKFIGRFGFKSARDTDKFYGVNFLEKEGIPLVLDHSLATFLAKVLRTLDCGTHTLFLGEILDAKVIREGEPMTYAYYQMVKGGVTPKSAPNYVKEDKKVLDRYQCNICGYIYDPEKGDPEADILASTSFEDLPKDWLCPICGAGKDEFTKI